MKMSEIIKMLVERLAYEGDKCVEFLCINSTIVQQNIPRLTIRIDYKDNQNENS